MIKSDIITGRQLRAARALAGLTQRGLGVLIGVDERQIRFMERRRDTRPGGARFHARIQAALFEAGVVFTVDPSPGVRMAK